MNKTKKFSAIIGLTLLVSTFLAGTMIVQAKSSHTRLSFVYTLVPTDMGDPEPWQSGKVWHLRNVGHIGEAWSDTADFYGTVSYLGNLNLFDDLNAPTTMNSVGWGAFSFTGWYNGEYVSFEGTLVLKINDFYVTGMFVCKGSDGFQGMRIMGIFEGIIGTVYSAQCIIH